MPHFIPLQLATQATCAYGVFQFFPLRLTNPSHVCLWRVPLCSPATGALCCSELWEHCVCSLLAKRALNGRHEGHRASQALQSYICPTNISLVIDLYQSAYVVSFGRKQEQPPPLFT